MSGGAFRDAGSAAFERVAILEQQNADLEAEVARLRTELAARTEQDPRAVDTELSRLKVQLAAERADLKEALTELNPIARKLMAAERAFHQAKDDERLATEEAAKAAGQLEIARCELALAREQIRELRIALKNAESNVRAQVEVRTEVPENLDAYMQRVQEERDELLDELRRLKETASSTRRASLFDVLFRRR